MSTYVIGDLQGCYAEFSTLLDKVQFDPASDSLWLVGDLINRGPDNTRVMDLILSLDDVTCVLGNHDLHFLAIATGQQTQKRSDTLDDLLSSSNLDKYVRWLRHQPLVHYDASRHCALVHAGIPPQFGIERCLELSGEVERYLRSSDHPEFLAAMYGNEPASWSDALSGMPRLRLITNYFTRLRYCKADGELELLHKSDIQPDGYAPWFSYPRSDGLNVLFGHWAALEGKADCRFALPLDTGCVWGRELTALRLEDSKRFVVQALRRH